MALCPFGSTVSPSLAFLDISITPRSEELEHITAHTQEKGFPARLVWDNERFSRSILICAPGPLPSRDSVRGCLCLSPHCGGTTASRHGLWGFPDVWRRFLCTRGTSWTPWAGRTLPGQGQAGPRLGGRMDFSGEWGLGEGQRMPMEDLREVREMSQEQAPPEARESLSHPSGDGRGAGGGLWSWAGQLHLLPHGSTSLCSQDMGKGLPGWAGAGGTGTAA